MNKKPRTADEQRGSKPASVRKLGDCNISQNPQSGDITGNRIVDMQVLSGVFESLKCPECAASGLTLSEEQRHGLHSQLFLMCATCGYENKFGTGPKTGKTADNNVRFVYAMRQLGKGRQAARRFCATMNMPPPLSKDAYADHNRRLQHALQEVAQDSMCNAAKEVKDMKSVANSVRDDPVDCGVSVDGTWQKRGHSSLNGSVAVLSIDTGKVLDIELMSSFCQKCRQIEMLSKDSLQYSLLRDHICKSNYKGSAPGMEPVGAYRIFERAPERNGLHYTEYYGDGDSKSYLTVKDIYGT